MPVEVGQRRPQLRHFRFVLAGAFFQRGDFAFGQAGGARLLGGQVQSGKGRSERGGGGGVVGLTLGTHALRGLLRGLGRGEVALGTRQGGLRLLKARAEALNLGQAVAPGLRGVAPGLPHAGSQRSEEALKVVLRVAGHVAFQLPGVQLALSVALVPVAVFTRLFRQPQLPGLELSAQVGEMFAPLLHQLLQQTDLSVQLVQVDTFAPRHLPDNLLTQRAGFTLMQVRTVGRQPRHPPRLFLASLGGFELLLGVQAVLLDPFELRRFFLLLAFFLGVALLGGFQGGFFRFYQGALHPQFFQLLRPLPRRLEGVLVPGQGVAVRELRRAPSPFEAGGVGLGFAQGAGLFFQRGNALLLRLGLRHLLGGEVALRLGAAQDFLGAAQFAGLALGGNPGAFGGVEQRQYPRHLPGAAGAFGPLAHVPGAAFLHVQAPGGVLAAAPDLFLLAQPLHLGLQSLALLHQPLGLGADLFAPVSHLGGGVLADPGVFAGQYAAQALRLVLELLDPVGGDGVHLLNAAQAGQFPQQFLALLGLAVQQRGELALRQHHAAGKGVEVQPHHRHDALRDVLLRAAAQAGPLAVGVEAVEPHLVVGLLAPARAGHAVGLPARLEGERHAQEALALRNQGVEAGGAQPRRFAVEGEGHRVEQTRLAAAGRSHQREQFEVGKVEVGGLPEGREPAQTQAQRLHRVPAPARAATPVCLLFSLPSALRFSSALCITAPPAPASRLPERPPARRRAARRVFPASSARTVPSGSGPRAAVPARRGLPAARRVPRSGRSG